jgi:hypothetical protein
MTTNNHCMNSDADASEKQFNKFINSRFITTTGLSDTDIDNTMQTRSVDEIRAELEKLCNEHDYYTKYVLGRMVGNNPKHGEDELRWGSMDASGDYPRFDTADETEQYRQRLIGWVQALDWIVRQSSTKTVTSCATAIVTGGVEVMVRGIALKEESRLIANYSPTK